VSRVHQPDKEKNNIAYHALLAFLDVKQIQSFTKERRKGRTSLLFPKTLNFCSILLHNICRFSIYYLAKVKNLKKVRQKGYRDQ
jgi:hypothetical protein